MLLASNHPRKMDSFNQDNSTYLSSAWWKSNPKIWLPKTSKINFTSRLIKMNNDQRIVQKPKHQKPHHQKRLKDNLSKASLSKGKHFLYNSILHPGQLKLAITRKSSLSLLTFVSSKRSSSKNTEKYSLTKKWPVSRKKWFDKTLTNLILTTNSITTREKETNGGTTRKNT